MGSVRMVSPSMRMRTVLCPSQAACTPRSVHRRQSGVLGALATGLCISCENCFQKAGAALYTKAPNVAIPVAPAPPIHARRASLPAKTLLLPRVAVHVVPVAFPETRPVLRQEFETGEPLGALPRIQPRHDQPRRSAVL